MRTSDNLLLVDEDERHKVHFDMECTIIVHEFVMLQEFVILDFLPPSMR